MTQRRENETKQRIRETATHLFRERSFEHVTLNDICEASGVNRHTFYYYFKSKDDLLDHYFDLPWDLSATEVADMLTADTYIDQLWLITKKFVDFIDHLGMTIVRQVLVQNMTKDVGTFRPHHRMRELSRLQISIIEKGQAAGQFKNLSDPTALVVLLQQTVHSTCLMWVVLNGSFDHAKHTRFLFETLLDVAEEYRETKEYDPHYYKDLAEEEAPQTN